MRIRATAGLFFLLSGLCVLVVTPAVAGVVINVPAAQPTIQAAINAASAGDTVVVAPGTYFERIDFKGKAIEVRSSAGPATTIIDGGGKAHVVSIKTGEARTSVLRGFTVTNGALGDDGYEGIGIYIVGASPTILGNVVTGNSAPKDSGGGVGIGVLNGSPLIQGNQIVDNPGGSIGGGIYTDGGNAEIVGNLIVGNSAHFGAGVFLDGGTLRQNVIRGNEAGSVGGGVMADNNVSMINNLIVDNSAPIAGGGVAWGPGVIHNASLVNNTVAGNVAPKGSAFFVGGSGATLMNNVLTGPAGSTVVSCINDAGDTVFAHNDVYNGTPSRYDGCADATGVGGNTSADPLLDANGGLLPGSPAIDTGRADPSVPTTDQAGRPRPTDGNGDGVAVVDMGAFEAPAVPVPSYHPLTPARILDTRTGNGAPAAKLGPDGVVSLQVTGRGGVPVDGVRAVVLNVTVTEPTAPSFLTAWPAGASRPLASNLNYSASQTVANLVTVMVGAGGNVSLLNSAGSTHVVADVAGWYGVGGGDRFTSLSPARLLDTRADAGPLAAGTATSLKVTGHGGVPSAGVSAVVLNLTATDTASDGWLAAWPAGESMPVASNLNYLAGQTVPNLVIVKVGAGGAVNIYSSGGPVHVIADVAGYFGEAGAGFASVVPARVLDTRSAGGPLAPGTSRSLQVTGQGGVPADGVAAVVLNVTVTEPASAGWLAAWPAGEALPLVSNLNYVAGQTVPNLVVVKVGAGGMVNLYSSGGPVHVVADVAGYFVD